MSFRGSFVTEYIYCKRCFLCARYILVDKYYAASAILPGRDNKLLPIIVGNIRDSSDGDEVSSFEEEYVLRLSEIICHQLRISLLAENSEHDRVINIRPCIEGRSERENLLDSAYVSVSDDERSVYKREIMRYREALGVIALHAGVSSVETLAEAAENALKGELVPEELPVDEKYRFLILNTSLNKPKVESAHVFRESSEYCFKGWQLRREN